MINFYKKKKNHFSYIIFGSFIKMIKKSDNNFKLNVL